MAIVFTDVGEFNNSTEIHTVADGFFPDSVCLGEEVFLQIALRVEVLHKGASGKGIFHLLDLSGH